MVLRPLFVLSCLALAPAAQQAAAPRPFPLIPTETVGTKGLLLEPDFEALDGLLELDAVALVGVALPTAEGFTSVDLELERIDPVADQAEVWIDGELAGGAELLRAQVSSWRGTVRGEDGTHVFLSFTPTGSYGWIYRGGSYAHVSPAPVDGHRWGQGRSLIVHASDPALDDQPTFTCAGGITPPRESVPSAPGSHAAAGTTRECFIAVETDWELYTLFSDMQAEMNYVVALWAAISDRFETQTNTTVSLPYLSLYSDPDDPWDAQPGGSGALLDQFRTRWDGGNIPMNANLAHFVSGANLGGGVAYVGTLCNPDFGFAVSGNLGGNTPLPVAGPGPLNWDFFVVAHETGHNFGSPHTHDYCPPLDECAAGSCSSGNVCGTGTIMSYCHGCPGGMNNIQPNYHPTAAANMANAVQNSCLGSCQSCGGGLVANFTANVTQGTNPLQVVFSDLTTGGTVTSRTWSFGDGTTSNAVNALHTYVEPGTYAVSLVVSGPNGWDSEHRGGYIQVELATSINSITDPVESLIPGLDQTVVITGQSFLPGTTLEIDNAPIATGFTIEDSTTIRFDLPPLGNGIHIATVANANGSASTFFNVEPPAGPVVQIGDGDPGTFLFSALGMNVEAAGPPFTIQLLVASPSNVPSVLPGKFSLALGNTFTQTTNLGAFLLNADGRASFNVPLPSLLNLPLWVQSLQLNLPIPAGFPWPASNLQEGLLLF